MDSKKGQGAVVSRLRQFVDANVNPDNSENFYDPSADDMGALVVALQHADISTDPNSCLLCLTVHPRPRTADYALHTVLLSQLYVESGIQAIHLAGTKDSVQEEVQPLGSDTRHNQSHNFPPIRTTVQSYSSGGCQRHAQRLL